MIIRRHKRVFTLSPRLTVLVFDPLPYTRILTVEYSRTELSKYYARIQTAVDRGLGMPAARLAERHTDAASKHSLCYFSLISELMITRWNALTCICKAETLAFTDCDYI